MKKQEDRDSIAMDVLKDIALNIDGIFAERQRAVDALTLFREKALPVFEHLLKRSTIQTTLRNG